MTSKILCACLLCATLGALYAAEENLLKNGNFETGELAPWKSVQAGNSLHKVVGGQLTITGNPSNKYNSFITLVQPINALDLEKEYLLSGKVRVTIPNTTGKKVEIAVREADENNRTIAYRTIAVNLSESDYVPYSLLFKPNPAAKSFACYVITGNLTAEDAVAVDDLFLGLPPKQAAKGTNMVINGDFENASLLPWKCAQQDGGVRLHRLSVNTSYGKQALQVCGNPANKYNKFIAFTQPLPALKADTAYVLSARVRAGLKDTKGKSFQINLREANAQGGTLQYIGLTINLADDVWKYYERIITPHKMAAQWQIYITSSGLETTDTVLVDNVRFAPEGEAGRPFDPAASGISLDAAQTLQAQSLEGLKAVINPGNGLLQELSAGSVVIHPNANAVSVVSIEENGVEAILNGKGIPQNGFVASANYDFTDGMFREVVTVKALRDCEDLVKIGVRHGFDPAKWTRHIDGLRPLRILPAGAPTIFSYGSLENDLNPGIWDTFQHTAYPVIILENADYFLLIGSRNLDDFVTLAPNHPGNYLPAWQRNPKIVKKGDEFRFETNWKLFDKKHFMLRDVWRFYQEHLQTKMPSLARFFPPKYPEKRHFYPGIFGSHTYMLKKREDRLPDGANVWFYSMHDNIHERYLTSGEWWSHGNSWAKKVSATELKAYMARLQNERHFNLIMYLRQLANLRDRETGRMPESWYKHVPGGALHLYGGGYELQLPPHVAEDVGYKSIPWGQHDFGNPEYREYYLKEIFAAMDYYAPRAIGWDMGSDLHEFSVIAETYDRLRKAGHKIRVVANESAGPTQAYADMVMLENGLMGGKHPEDFEIAKAYTTAVVCLERWNIFQLAYDAYTTGKKTWLADFGLAANKRYLDALYARRPELKSQRVESARLCQLRASLYDLALGASPGYMEEAAPVPPALMRMAGDINGLLAVNESFAVTFTNNSNIQDGTYCNAWQENGKLRIVAFNDNATPRTTTVRLRKSLFANLGWSIQDLRNAACFAVTAEGQKDVKLNVAENDSYWLISGELEPFTSWLMFLDK